MANLGSPLHIRDASYCASRCVTLTRGHPATIRPEALFSCRLRLTEGSGASSGRCNLIFLIRFLYQDTSLVSQVCVVCSMLTVCVAEACSTHKLTVSDSMEAAAREIFYTEPSHVIRTAIHKLLNIQSYLRASSRCACGDNERGLAQAGWRDATGKIRVLEHLSVTMTRELHK